VLLLPFLRECGGHRERESCRRENADCGSRFHSKPPFDWFSLVKTREEKMR
jgi:hypothetical protein